MAGWDHAWERALDLAWDAFCAGTTPVGADPYAGTGHLDFGIPQTRNRPLRVTGPLPGERSRLAELLHIVFLIQRPAGPHVLAAPSRRPVPPAAPSRPPRPPNEPRSPDPARLA